MVKSSSNIRCFQWRTCLFFKGLQHIFNSPIAEIIWKELDFLDQKNSLLSKTFSGILREGRRNSLMETPLRESSEFNRPDVTLWLFNFFFSFLTCSLFCFIYHSTGQTQNSSPRVCRPACKQQTITNTINRKRQHGRHFLNSWPRRVSMWWNRRFTLSSINSTRFKKIIL